MISVSANKKNTKHYAPQNQEIRQQVHALMKANTGKTLVALATEWGLILGVAALSWSLFNIYGITPLTLGVYILTIFIIGTRQRALECLIHEAIHMNLSRKRWLNDLLAWTFAALPLCHNLYTERFAHLIGHHKNFWDLEHDPDYRRYRAMGIDQLPAQSYGQLLSILIRGVPLYIAGTITTFFLPKGEKWTHRCGRILFWTTILGMTATLSGHLILPILYWFLPLFIPLTVIRYLGEISEHASLGCSDEFGSTRNNLGWVNQVFLHPRGDAYHLVHHLYPKVPFFNVAAAHKLLLQDTLYREAGHHCSGFIIKKTQNKSTIQEMVVSKPQEVVRSIS